jgi:hypothetical protein
MGRDYRRMWENKAKKERMKDKVRQETLRAIHLGIIKRGPCQQCEAERTPQQYGAERTLAHHPNYSKPLNVIWLCPKHHVMLHAQERLDRKAIWVD